MAHMIIRHKVKDFDKWKVLYDKHEDARAKHGIKEAHLWRSMDDINEVIVLFELSDMDRAHEFHSSENLKSAMQEAGVIGKPEFIYVSEA